VHEIPKWNCCGIMAPSIPSWKYFIFGGSCGSFEEGGNRTASKFVDETFYLDIDNLKWNIVHPELIDKDPLLKKPKVIFFFLNFYQIRFCD
jgi:hypothetical protein